MSESAQDKHAPLAAGGSKVRPSGRCGVLVRWSVFNGGRALQRAGLDSKTRVCFPPKTLFKVCESDSIGCSCRTCLQQSKLFLCSYDHVTLLLLLLLLLLLWSLLCRNIQTSRTKSPAGRLAAFLVSHVFAGR